MSIYPTEVFAIDKKEAVIDKGELARRLAVDKSFDFSAFDGIMGKAFEVINAKCVYMRVPVMLCDEKMCELGFTRVSSRDLQKNLTGCSEAFVFAVTLGFEADRYLNKLSKTSSGEFFICDGFFSAAAEAVCDAAEKRIKANLCCRPRFSPGYGDLSLEIQRDILTALNALRHCGISLTDSLLMTPQKSITAIMGIKD